jgi:antitoxin ParD1/3/4
VAINLDPATEQRIERELARGHFASPDEVVSQALDLLDADRDWLDMDKAALDARLQESIAQIERGEGIPGDRLLETLADRRKLQKPA